VQGHVLVRAVPHSVVQLVHCEKVVSVVRCDHSEKGQSGRENSLSHLNSWNFSKRSCKTEEFVLTHA
jgi:hypothetical protein